MNEKKLVVAVTGASGAIYAKSFLQKLKSLADQYTRVDVVMTKNAREVWLTELGTSDYDELPYTQFETDNFFAPFASGSAGYDCMVIIPCSMGVLGRIATGVSNDLITRAADVMLKERRKLICVVRETPYNLIHIKNMETVALAGGIICPATPSFYSKPATIEQLVETVTDRVLNLAGLQVKSFKWGEQ